MNIFQARLYEEWAPVLGRALLAVPFLMASLFKIPGTDSFVFEVGLTQSVGVPFPEIAVTLALLLEVVAGVSILIGWKTRLFAFLLVLFTILLTILFHSTFADMDAIAAFINHLVLIGGLLYLSVYGAQYAAVKKCPLPKGLHDAH
jgi:putative oxidoreductase